MAEFRIADNLCIDSIAAAGKRFAVVGKSGSGKTNSLFVFSEAWMDAGWPVVIVDPMGEFRDLKKAYPVLVAGLNGGEDLPITPDNAARVAEVCFRERLSVVLDVSMHPQGEDIETLVAFLQPFWQMILAQKKEDAAPYALAVDEAQLYAPQRGETDLSPILIDMGKRGRHKNLTMMVATQRPASIQKDFLTQTNLMVWHRIMLGTDTAILQESLPLPTKELNAMMRRFSKGQALVIGDGELIGDEDYLTVQVLLSRTASLQGNEAGLKKGGTGLRAIELTVLETLRKAVGEPAAPEQDKDEIIQQLRMRIHRLEMEEPKKIVEVSILKDEHVAELRRVAEQAIERGQAAIEHGQILLGMGQEMLLAIGKAKSIPPVFAISPVITVSAQSPEAVPSGARRILQSIAQRYPTRLSRAQIGTLSGFTPSGGTFSNYWSILRKRGFLDEQGAGVTVTSAAFNYLGTDVPPKPATTEELLDLWRGALAKGERAMLDVLVQRFPEWMTRVQLGDLAGYTASGGTFGNYLGTLRNNGLAVVEGQRVRASETLFMEVERIGR